MGRLREIKRTSGVGGKVGGVEEKGTSLSYEERESSGWAERTSYPQFQEILYIKRKTEKSDVASTGYHPRDIYLC